MNYIPIIKIPKMRSTGDDWCKHYAGFFDKDAPMSRRAKCDVGVEYASVEKRVEFFIQRHNETAPYKKSVAHPCFKSESHLTGGCAKCHYHNEQELRAIHAERGGQFNSVGVAREAILQELRRRWKERPTPDHGITAPSDISRFYQPQTNYFCGQGVMDCPICKTGKLSYSRSTYNGHVHARCSTEGCVAWME